MAQGTAHLPCMCATQGCNPGTSPLSRALLEVLCLQHLRAFSPQQTTTATVGIGAYESSAFRPWVLWALLGKERRGEAGRREGRPQRGQGRECTVTYPAPGRRGHTFPEVVQNRLAHLEESPAPTCCREGHPISALRG